MLLPLPENTPQPTAAELAQLPGWTAGELLVYWHLMGSRHAEERRLPVAVARDSWWRVQSLAKAELYQEHLGSTASNMGEDGFNSPVWPFPELRGIWRSAIPADLQPAT